MNKLIVIGIMLLLMTTMVSARNTQSYKATNANKDYTQTTCDMNKDGTVNLSDVSLIAQLIGQDLNGDGTYNLSDVVIIAKLLYQPGFCNSIK